MAVDLEMAVLVPLSLLVARPLNAMQLGDETARGLGVRLQSAQLFTLVAAVGLVSVAVAAVGPLEFVAFVSPPDRPAADRRPRLRCSPRWRWARCWSSAPTS